MGVVQRRKLQTVKDLTAQHGLAVKQVKSLEETAFELGKIKKREAGTPGALKPVTLTERSAKGTKSITVEPTVAYGPTTGAKRRRKK